MVLLLRANDGSAGSIDSAFVRSTSDQSRTHGLMAQHAPPIDARSITVDRVALLMDSSYAQLFIN